MKTLTSVILCFLFLCYGCIFADYRVSGDITDYLLSAPAESCLVKLKGLSPNTKTDSIRTGSNGRYEFGNVPAGAYEIRIQDSRYIPDSMFATVDRDTVFSFVVFEAAHVLQEGSLPDTLTKSGSPYLVLKEVCIQNPLTICAGTKIVLFKKSVLLFEEDLIAEGTASDSIRFIGDYFVKDRDSLELNGARIYLRKVFGNGSYIFKYCRFDNLSYIFPYLYKPLYVGFEQCLFYGMFTALWIDRMGSPYRLAFKNNRVLNCINGITSFSDSKLADSLFMCDNLLRCEREALYLVVDGKTYVRRNTFLGISTIDLRNVSADDTLASNIFEAIIFGNAQGKSVFLAYNDIPFFKDSTPLGVGRATLTNTNGDSCDFYYNIAKNPVISDSATGALQKTSPCIAAGFGGENIGVYQGSEAVRPYGVRRFTPSGVKVLSVRRTGMTIILNVNTFPFTDAAGTRAAIYSLSGRNLQKRLIFNVNDRGVGTTALRLLGVLPFGSYVLGLAFGDCRCFTRFSIDH